MSQRLEQRIQEEIAILKREITTLGEITMGTVPVGKHRYIGVHISGIRVNSEKFGGSAAVGFLLLVSSEYPGVPPIGIYLDRPYELAKKEQREHFVAEGYHGAPSLVSKGWYWFCHKIGSFEEHGGGKGWNPTNPPDKGHNLATIIMAAILAIQGDV